MKKPLISSKPYIPTATHPFELAMAGKLSPLKGASIKTNIQALWDLPYPADPLIEPEFEGLTYGQVACYKQMQKAANGDGEALERIMDRLIGRPVSTNTNLNINKTYKDFLDEVAANESKQAQQSKGDIEDADFRPDTT